MLFSNDITLVVFSLGWSNIKTRIVLLKAKVFSHSKL